MRFIYADPGLHGLTGHHPNVCRSIVDQLGALSIPTLVLAFAGVEPRLGRELKAVPFFRHNQYWCTDHDPLCGPLYAFHAGAQLTREDLHRNLDVRPDDLVFLPWALPAQFWGVVQWLSDLPPSRLPRVIVNFLDVPSVALEQRDGKIRLAPGDDRVEPSAIFLRFAARHVGDVLARRIRLGCTFPEGVAVLGAVLDFPVEQLPAPQNAVTCIRPRSAAWPKTIGMVGHQQSAKGVSHMPHLARGILDSHPGAHILIHDSSNDLAPEVADELSHLAARDPRFSVQRKALDGEGWADLLNRIDVLLCPYSREVYRLCSSGVHNEAIANGIPSIVPSETTLETQAKAFGDGSVTFGPGEPASIIDALRRVLDNFDHHAAAAHQGALLWRQLNGPQKLCERLLDNTPSRPLPASATITPGR